MRRIREREHDSRRRSGRHRIWLGPAAHLTILTLLVLLGGCASVPRPTIELSEVFIQEPEDLDNYWQWNRRALLDFIAHAHRGIRGIVTAHDGTPLDATIEIVGIDRQEDGSLARTDPAIGDFHRLLLPGLYDLRVEAAGYLPRDVRGVVVTDGEATVVDVVLYRELVRRPSRRTAPNPVKSIPSRFDQE